MRSYKLEKSEAIEKQKREHLRKLEEIEIKYSLLEQFPDIHWYCRIWDSNNQTRSHIWCELTADEGPKLQTIMSAFPPTEKTHVIEHTRMSTVNSPYRVDICNDVRKTQYKVQWEHNDMEISVKIDIVHGINHGDLRATFRKLYDSEFHYFAGMNNVRNHKVPSFEVPQARPYVSWYGGNKTLLSDVHINEILHTIINPIN